MLRIVINSFPGDEIAIESKFGDRTIFVRKKTGRWEGQSDGDFACSECGWESDAKYDYCPNCGSFNMEAFK